MENEVLLSTVFCEMCSQLNEEQQKLFNFVMRYSQELQLNKRNDLPDLNPFHIFLSGGAGVRKSFTKAMTEYMKKTLKTVSYSIHR